MKRFLSADRKFWITQDDNGNYNIGLTKAAIRDLGEVVNVVAQITRVKGVEKGERLYAFETHRCLQSLKLPIAGLLTYYSRDLEENPTLLNEHLILATLQHVKAENLEQVA